MSNVDATVESPIQLELDWEAYFENFRALHGWPVPYGNRWLFPDGWTYSMSSLEGPEWPPPEDPQTRTKLKKEWTTIRKRIIQSQHRELSLIVTGLRELIEAKNATLQQKVVEIAQDAFGDEYTLDTGKSKPIDIAPLEQRLEVLREEMRQLRGESDGDPRTNQPS